MSNKIKIPLTVFTTHRRIPAGGFVFGTHRFIPGNEAADFELPAELDFKKLSIQQNEDGSLYLELES